jgi:hypothetical protein
MVAVVVLGATVAEAAVKSGTYKGPIKKAGNISVKVDANKQVVKIVRTGFKLKCSNGKTATITKSTTTGTIPVDSEGRFLIKANQDDLARGHYFRVSGTINSPKASGTVREDQRFTPAGVASGDGSVKCTSGKLTWTAKRQ